MDSEKDMLARRLRELPETWDTWQERSDIHKRLNERASDNYHAMVRDGTPVSEIRDHFEGKTSFGWYWGEYSPRQRYQR